MPYADPKQRKTFTKKWREENKDALREYNKKWREENKEYHNERAALYHRRSMRARRKELADLLGGKCQRCGFSDSRAFQFHHRDGNGGETRREHGGDAGYYKKMIEESKSDPGCIELLCSNCHVIEHWIPDTEYTPGKRRGRFTEDEVEEIRASHARGVSFTALASQYNTQRQTIRKIINRDSYA